MIRKSKSILLASHGTAGALAAEKAALALCGAGTRLWHLIVVPDFWKGMMGDDWLNSVHTRDDYGRYVESTLADDVRREVNRLRRLAARRRVRYEAVTAFGKPEACLLAEAAKRRPGLVVLGAPRPRGQGGLRSRMLTEDVLRALRAPVLVVPRRHG
jgi:nucleotide-binding universal stress UspA family protein